MPFNGIRMRNIFYQFLIFVSSHLTFLQVYLLLISGEKEWKVAKNCSFFTVWKKNVVLFAKVNYNK